MPSPRSHVRRLSASTASGATWATSPVASSLESPPTRSTTAARSRSSRQSPRLPGCGWRSICPPGERRTTRSRRSSPNGLRLLGLRPPAAQRGNAEQQRAPRAELAQHVQAVRRGPVLDDFAVLDPADHNPPDPDRTTAIVALGDPARRDPVVLGYLVLHANAQVAVTEDELVEAERPPDPVVARVVASVDVIAEVSAVDADRSRRVAARADPLERIAGEPGRVASRHRPPPPRDLPPPPNEPPSHQQPSTHARAGSRGAARWSARSRSGVRPPRARRRALRPARVRPGSPQSSPASRGGSARSCRARYARRPRGWWPAHATRSQGRASRGRPRGHRG